MKNLKRNLFEHPKGIPERSLGEIIKRILEELGRNPRKLYDAIINGTLGGISRKTNVENVKKGFSK